MSLGDLGQLEGGGGGVGHGLELALFLLYELSGSIFFVLLCISFYSMIF